MAEDNTQRTIKFILEQQAQLTATMGQLSERVDKLAEKVDRTADAVNALLTIAEIHEREIEADRQAAATNSGDIAALKAAIEANAEANAEAGRATDERINALVIAVEQLISDRRNGGK